MRRWALLLALCACPRVKSPPTDSVVAEVHTPLHVTIRTREVEEPVDCKDVHGLEWAKCLFRTKTTACAWLELDSPVDPLGPSLNDCTALPSTGARVGLDQLSPHTAFTLNVAPTGDRLAIEGGAALVMWVLDGEVVGSVKQSAPVDWSAIETLAEQLPALFEASYGPPAQKLIDHARRTGGDAALLELMKVVENQELDRWAELYEGLDEDELKANALASLHARLRRDPNLAAVTSLIEYPELQPKDFGKLIADLAAAQVAQGGTWYDHQPLLDEMLNRHDPGVGELACRLYGQQVIGTMHDSVDAYDELSDSDTEYGALTIVAKTKVPCPWVQIALDKEPCSVALRCQSDGGLQTDDMLDENYGSDGDVPVSPLCTRSVADSALLEPVEDLDDRSHQGPVLLSAGWARGAVSAELLKRNARRMYRIDYPPVVRPAGWDGGDELEDWELVVNESPCRRPRALSDAVCHLPLNVTELAYGACRLRIDDKAQVIRVEELKVK